MFELIRSISIDTENGRAVGVAEISPDHPLFADHFPGAPLLPGSLLIEIAAQVAGPLAEETFRSRNSEDRWALLGMVREAKFHRPVHLPAKIDLTAELKRIETTNASLQVEASVGGELVMRGNLVVILNKTESGWEEAIEARNRRVATWTE